MALYFVSLMRKPEKPGTSGDIGIAVINICANATETSEF